MKKAFAALLILTMLVAAVAVAEGADVAGTWYLLEMSQGGQSYDPASMGMSITMELNADGTAVLTNPMAEEPENGTWTLDGDTITVVDESGVPMVLTMADGKLTANEDDLTMTFGREIEGGVFAPAAPVEAAEEDFNGTWEAYKVGAMGGFLDASVLNEQMGTENFNITIEGGQVTLNGFMFSGQSTAATFADGKLTLSELSDASGVGIVIQMLEDGTMALNMDAGEQGSFAFYLNRAA